MHAWEVDVNTIREAESVAQMVDMLRPTGITDEQIEMEVEMRFSYYAKKTKQRRNQKFGCAGTAVAGPRPRATTLAAALARNGKAERMGHYAERGTGQMTRTFSPRGKRSKRSREPRQPQRPLQRSQRNQRDKTEFAGTSSKDTAGEVADASGHTTRSRKLNKREFKVKQKKKPNQKSQMMVTQTMKNTRSTGRGVTKG